MKAERDSIGNYIVPAATIKDFKFWRKIAKHALDTEVRIEESYARTWGEEGEIALEKLAEELFGIEVNFMEKKVL